MHTHPATTDDAGALTSRRALVESGAMNGLVVSVVGARVRGYQVGSRWWGLRR
ncbi:hypothetical protein DFJ69_1424 [Thermomonospora umbrina]|uniref:Uncharacterized protein n=1 Tax=Thermomonospora umbrina TaxID=111806 RepID=A0A3D9STV4_9ACTN|nr:hypothetical protein DFJ69_1424 [Thermomonospora umbrina]